MRRGWAAAALAIALFIAAFATRATIERDDPKPVAGTAGAPLISPAAAPGAQALAAVPALPALRQAPRPAPAPETEAEAPAPITVSAPADAAPETTPAPVATPAPAAPVAPPPPPPPAAKPKPPATGEIFDSEG